MEIKLINCRFFRKRLLIMIMKSFIFLMCTTVFSLATENSFAQQKVLIEKNQTVTVDQVFEIIKEQTEFNFVYPKGVFKNMPKVELQKGEITVLKLLEKTLVTDNLNIQVTENNTIFINKNDILNDTMLQQYQISGVVTDENGQPLPGANIIEKGTANGVTTDFDGNFLLKVASKNATLIITYVGFKDLEVAVGEKTKFNIVLEENASELDEVVVVGYGTVKKSDLTGSVASIKQQDIVAVPTNNVLESLQGKIAGVDLVRESGKVGAPIKMTVRGNRSLRANNSPLILVDGVAFGSDVNINPNDVESIEVLKDASATAIYGSRGANGVIMITTKKGKVGKPQININMYNGINNLTRYPILNNLDQYVAQRREANRATGDWASPGDDASIFSASEYDLIQQGNNTDWYDVLYSQGLVQDYQVSISGGSESTTVALSLDYYKEKGVLKNDKLDRYSGRFNVNQKVTDKLSAGASVFFNFSNANQRRDAIFDQAQKMAPYGVPYNADGSINRYPFGNTDVNPLVDGFEENYINSVNSYQTFLATNIDYKIVEGLVFRSNLGLNLTNYKNGIFEGLGSTAFQNNQGLSKASKLDRVSRGVTWENTLTYDKTFGEDHAVTFLLGNSVLSNYRETSSAVGYDLGYEQAQYHNLGSAAGDKQVGSSLTKSSLLSYFGRLNYRLMEKYLLTFTLRADGSSVLGANNKWSYFPSAAFAWRISEEDFLSQSSVISNLKLRTSLGVSGNSAVDPYQSTGVLSQTVYSFEEAPAYGYQPNSISNSDLKWERTKSFNTGLDFGFLKNRITGSIDVYKTWTTDLLMNRLIPAHTGYDNVLANVGATETQGIDVVISSHNVDKGDFEWTTDLTFSTNKEKITKLNEGQDDIGNGWFIGSPINVFYDYEKTGIWQSSEATEAAIYGQEPGDIKVKDINNNNEISASDDRIIVGQSTPKWSLGLNNRFSYKGFDLSAFVIARIGQTISSQAAGHFRPDSRENSSVVDYWTPENPTNAYPRPSANKNIGSMLYASTLGYSDGSFVKIRTVTLGYNLPSNVVDKMGMSSIRLYGTAKNYFTFSHFDNYDPERGGASSYPMTKQLVFGLNLSF